MFLLQAQPFGTTRCPSRSPIKVCRRRSPCHSGRVMIRGTALLRQATRAFASWPLAAPRTVSIIGAPQQFGQPRGGVENAPKLLRAAGLAETVSRLDWRVNDAGDVDMQTTQAVAGPLRLPPTATTTRSFQRARQRPRPPPPRARWMVLADGSARAVHPLEPRASRLAPRTIAPLRHRAIARARQQLSAIPVKSRKTWPKNVTFCNIMLRY